MFNIFRQGSSLIITSNDNSQYPWKDGQMSIPLNSVNYIIDESEYITFRSSANNDILFTALINEIRINDNSVDKDSIISMFDNVANSAGNGGGGGGGDATAGVNSINGFQGDLNIKSVNGKSLIGSGNIEIEIPKTDLSDYYTKSEVEDLIPTDYLTSIPSEYITETELNAKGYLTSIPSEYAKKTDLPKVPTSNTAFTNDAGYITLSEVPKTDLSNYYKKSETYTKSEVNELIDGVSTGDIDLTNYYTKEQTYSKSEVDDLIPTDYIKTIPSEYVTETELNDKGYLTQHQSLANYYTKSEVDNLIPTDYVTNTDLDKYVTEDEIPEIPKAQDNMNGSSSNFIYSVNSWGGGKSVITYINPSNQYNSDNITTTLSCLIWGATDITQGNDITLIFNAATENSAGIMSSKDKVKLDSLNTDWTGTQAEYDALGTYDDNTTYNIIEG